MISFGEIIFLTNANNAFNKLYYGNINIILLTLLWTHFISPSFPEFLYFYINLWLCEFDSNDNKISQVYFSLDHAMLMNPWKIFLFFLIYLIYFAQCFQNDRIKKYIVPDKSKQAGWLESEIGSYTSVGVGEHMHTQVLSRPVRLSPTCSCWFMLEQKSQKVLTWCELSWRLVSLLSVKVL